MTYKKAWAKEFWEQYNQGDRYQYMKEWGITSELHPYICMNKWDELHEDDQKVIQKAHKKGFYKLII